jgi:uncharacterized membrane protein
VGIFDASIGSILAILAIGVGAGVALDRFVIIPLARYIEQTIERGEQQAKRQGKTAAALSYGAVFLITPVLLVLIDALGLGREGFSADFSILGLFVAALLTVLGIRVFDAPVGQALDRFLKKRD